MRLFSLSQAIDRFLVPWNELDWPPVWRSLFGRDGPLRLELGFGNGEFLAHAAIQDATTNWIGVEVSWGSVVRLLKRLDQTGIGNVRVVHGDGALALERLFPPDSLEEVVINHSDPWPKKRHHERRLIQPGLIRTLSRRLGPGGRVVIVTDHEAYANWITEVLEAQNTLTSTYAGSYVNELPDHTPTKYERKGVEAGSKIYYFDWKKTSKTPAHPTLTQKVEPMPNVLLEGKCDFAELLSGFENQNWSDTHREVPIFIQLAAAYLRQDGKEWLVETRVKEGSYAQHFVISISKREPDRILIKPSPAGSPRPTWGVKRALKQMVERICASHPGLEIRASGVEEPNRSLSDSR